MSLCLGIATAAGLEALEVVIPMDIGRERLAAREISNIMAKHFFQTWKAKAKEVQEKIMCPFRIAYLQLNEIVLNTGIDIRAVESDGLPSVHTGNKREARILKQPLGL